MNAPTFRFATQADVDPLVTLIERAYRGQETAGSWFSEAHLLRGPRTSHADISSLIAPPDSQFLVAEIDGRIAGCCLIQLQRSRQIDGHAAKSVDSAAYFGMFAIDPRINGAGLGKLVLAEAERTAQRVWGANALVMTVINVRAELIEYYKRRGYSLTGARYPFPFSETTGEVTRDFDLVEMRKAFE